MWNLKVDVIEEKGIFSKICRRNFVQIQYIPLNNYFDKKFIYFTSSGYIIGEDKQIKKTIKELKSNKKTTYLEVNNNYFILTYKEPLQASRGKEIKSVYNPKLIFSKPILVDEKGIEYWDVNSIERTDLDILLKLAEKNPQVRYNLKKLKKQKIQDVVMFSILPKLSSQQRKAIFLAIKRVYYTTPRKVTLKELAQEMKISLSTFQEHLTRAEKKVIPSSINKF